MGSIKNIFKVTAALLPTSLHLKCECVCAVRCQTFRPSHEPHRARDIRPEGVRKVERELRYVGTKWNASMGCVAGAQSGLVAGAQSGLVVGGKFDSPNKMRKLISGQCFSYFCHSHRYKCVQRSLVNRSPVGLVRSSHIGPVSPLRIPWGAAPLYFFCFCFLRSAFDFLLFRLSTHTHIRFLDICPAVPIPLPHLLPYQGQWRHEEGPFCNLTLNLIKW